MYAPLLTSLQCNPNLVVIPVWVDNLDLLMPRLAFFSSRDIRKHEELTFDYRVNGRVCHTSMLSSV